MKKLYKVYIVTVSILFAIIFWLSYQFYKNYTVVKKIVNSISKTYQGVIPCADCEGMDIKIEIFGDNYKTTTMYLGKKVNKFVEEGKIKLDGDIIEIDDHYYRIEEDGLLLLDMEKQVIDSEFNYKLKLIK